MKPRSLRLRLLLVSATSIAFALVLAGTAITSIFTSHLERSLAIGLEARLARLVALIDPNQPEPRLTEPMSDPRYDIPAGGLYWQIGDPLTGQVARSRSLWDTVLKLPVPLPAGGQIETARIAGPHAEEALVLGRRLSFERDDSIEERVLEIFVAEDTRVIRDADAAFRSDLLRALAILAIALVAATWIQVTLGLSPLDLIKRGIAGVRAGRSKTLEGDFPAEVMPLVAEVNDLLAVQDRSIEFARSRAADLAHGLKTSLTLLNGEAHELRLAGNAAAATAIERLTDDMSAVVDHQLRLSRLRHRSRTDMRSTALAAVAGKVVAAIKKTPEGRELQWDIAIPEEAVVALDTMDLTELLGVFVENAAKWARRRVELRASLIGPDVRIDIADDGPGLGEADLAMLGQRGRRLDESRPGHGLGLAIGREIVSLNDGQLSFGHSALGGLEVTATLRAGHPA